MVTEHWAPRRLPPVQGEGDFPGMEIRLSQVKWPAQVCAELRCKPRPSRHQVIFLLCHNASQERVAAVKEGDEESGKEGVPVSGGRLEPSPAAQGWQCSFCA